MPNETFAWLPAGARLTNQVEQDPSKAVRAGISAVKAGDYVRGLNLLSLAYNNSRVTSPEGLSFYGLALAIVEKKYRPAIDFCKKAIELQFYNPDHYANACRVYLAAGMRRKAYETIQKGLHVMPEEETLLTLQSHLGQRARPAIPFLGRSNPLNQAIGKARHATTKRKRKSK